MATDKSQILERITDGFFALDGEARFVYVNRRAEQTFQRTRKALLGRSVWEVFPQAAERRVFEVYQRAMKEQRPVRFEETLPGVERCFAVHVYPDSEGVSVYFRDITDRKRAEEALRESEARFRLMVEGSDQGFFYSRDAEGTLRYLSPSVREVLGYLPEELAGKHYSFLMTGHRSDVLVHELTQEQVAHGTRPVPYVTCARHREGKKVMLELVEGPLEREGEGITVQGFAREVTHRERLEEERLRLVSQVQEKQALLEAVLEQMPTGIALAEAASGKLIYHNAEAIRLCRHEIIVREGYGGYVEYGALRDNGTPLPAEEYPLARALLDQERVVQEEIRYRRGDGTETVLSVNAAPVMGSDGEVTAAVASFQDISEQKRKNEDLHRALEQAESATRARDEVVAIVSHDLKNPLNAIQLRVATLMEVPLSDEARRDALRSIERTTERMDRLINGLLDTRRLDAGQMLTVNPCRARVKDLIKEAGALFQPQAEMEGIRLVCHADDDCPDVQADFERVLQVFWNLVGNAVKFSSEGGSVEIYGRREGKAVRFSVTDTGPGILPEDLPRLFDPYWQAKRTARLGTGLGLHISKALVEAQGGEIRVESCVGKGTTFSFTLPANSQPRLEPGTTDRHPSIPESVSPTGRSAIRRSS